MNSQTDYCLLGGSGNKHQSLTNKAGYFDCCLNKWKSLKPFKIARYDVGICYDEKTDIIYLGGGRGKNKIISHIMECYDVSKNKWFMLPPRKMQYANHPQIWKRNNTLYIASICEYSNGLEFIDLRQNRKK